MKDRNKVIAELKASPDFDVTVIGGGASGIGAALESVLRGYKTLLVEKHDFTKGTSSKSTKLIHGGVRYMAQGDLKMVVEALKERGHLVKNAPHLVHDQAFIIPAYRWWEGAFYTIGLTFYDLLAGRYSLGRSRFVNKKNTLKALPGISPKKLRGGILYHDGQFDDSRLAMDLLHAYSEQGGYALNYFEAKKLSKDKDGQIKGIVCKDSLSGEEISSTSKAVVNAAGVWVDDIMEMDTPGHERSIRPSQGVHLVLPKKFLNGKHALMIPKTSDGRVLFAVPWHEHLVVGTTDTPLNVSSEEPVALKEEIDFILSTAANYMDLKPERKDVLSVFAGLRPLAAPKKGETKTKEISRNHKILVSKSKLITIIGGKWTTYRKMAEDILDTAIKNKLLPYSESRSKNFRISSQSETNSEELFIIYGNKRSAIKALTEDDPSLSEKIHQDLPYTWAEIKWLSSNEMAVHLEDILARRTRSLLLNARAASDVSDKVAKFIAEDMGWSPAKVKEEITSFKALAMNYIL